MAKLPLKVTTMSHVLKITSNANNIFYKLRYYSSALFIPGSRASETFSLLSPEMDFDKRFADIVKLQHELDCRKLNINASELKDSWDYYKYIGRNKKIVDEKREKVSNLIKKINKKNTLNDIDKNEIEKLKLEGTVLKRDSRIIREALWEIEESVIPRLLKLPNELDEKSPIESVVMRSVRQKREPPENKRKNHIMIGKSLGLLDYTNPLTYYLCDDAALFEIGVTTWAAKLLTDKNISRVSGTDFSRSFVVEASGLNHEDPFHTFLLANNEDIPKASCNRLHLAGGASLLAFLAMHTKQLINPKILPSCYYSVGRQYQPFDESLQPNWGLFSVSQATAVHCMALAKDTDSDEYKEQFEKLINAALELYDNLGVHYRVVLRSIHDLELSESLRISFELWSSSYETYIEVGHLSLYGNYFSKKLLIAYQTSTGRCYPAIISGTVLSVPKLLGCLLEENDEKFIIPECVSKYNPVGKIHNTM